jgi:putative tryptophan/tyrosine transport system substrate-binding protein
MMHGHEKSDLAIVAAKPANKVVHPAVEQSTVGPAAAEPVERRAGTKGNADRQSTHWTQSQARVSQALGCMRQALAVWTRGRSRMRESRTYGSERGARESASLPLQEGARGNSHPYLDRRHVITLLGGAAAAWPLTARAQQGGMPTIGLLWPADAPPVFPRMESFRQGLRASGLVEGQNVALELRYAQRGPQQLPELAADLVRLKADAIFTGGDLAARVAQQATRTIPIITISDDIIGAGLIASLSRPGGNITGVTILAPELSAKRLEVLRDIIPGLSRVTALHDPTNGTSQVTMAESAARALNVKLQVLDIKNRDDVARAIRAARDTQAQALNVFFSPLLSSLHREIITLAAEYGLPAIYQWKEHVEAGGLVSYGPNLAAMWRQSAVITAKILKGAKPADVPVEQPTKLELVVNFKTAKSLDLIIPPSVLLRADEVIE